MILQVAAVSARLAASVADLAGRLYGASDFAAVVDNNQLPQVTPAAFVLPGSLRGLEPDAAAGLFRQSFDQVVSVVLVSRVAGDPFAQAALDEITPLIEAVIHAIAGWAPDSAIGVFQLVQGELIGAKDSALVFQIDFTLNDQLRITTP